MTRPYTRSVFGADTGLGCIDPPSLHFDMGPYAGSSINPHAFASGHQYGAAPGLRGQFVMQSRRAGRLGATLPPNYNPNAWPMAQLMQSFVYVPSRGLRGIGPQFTVQSPSDPAGTPAVVVTPTVPVIPAQTSVMMTAQNAATGQQMLTVGPTAPALAHSHVGLSLVGLVAGALIATVFIRKMAH